MATRTTAQCVCCGKPFEIKRETRRCPKCARADRFVPLAEYSSRAPVKKPKKEGAVP